MAMGKRAVEENEEEIAVAAMAVKKAAKKAKKAAAAPTAEAVVEEAEVQAEDPEAAALAAKKAAKKAKKAAAAAVAEPEAAVEDPDAAALAEKKAAKKAKKAAAAAAAEAEAEAEDPEAAALEAKKAAKKAKKAAAAAAAEAEAKDEDEAPAPKKQKTEEAEAAPAPKKEEPAKAAAAEDEEFKDSTYKCTDCSEDWVDTAAEQQFRWDKGFNETPKRCKDCRWAKKVRMEGGDPAAKGKSKGKGKNNKELEVFIGGLPFSTTEEMLKKDFSECGEIVSMRLPLNDEGTIRGIAFLEFENMEAVEKALKFNETEYGGRWLSVRRSGVEAPASGKDGKGKGKGKDGKGKDGKGKGNKEFEVFVGGLSFSATEETFRKDFSECGEIVNLKMPLNEEGKPKGIAFVEYKDKESCDKALKFHDTEYGGRTVSVRMSGDGGGKDGKGKGKDGKDKGKGKGKKGKKGNSEAFSKSTGAMVESTGTKQTFADSDDE